MMLNTNTQARSECIQIRMGLEVKFRTPSVSLNVLNSRGQVNMVMVKLIIAEVSPNHLLAPGILKEEGQILTNSMGEGMVYIQIIMVMTELKIDNFTLN